MMISGLKLMLAGTAALTLPAMPAAAATITTIYGGGSSTSAPYIRQAGDCFGVNEPLIVRGTPPTVQTLPPFKYTGKPAQNCAKAKQDHAPHSALDDISASSGVGINGFFSHDPKQLGTIDANGDFFPTVNYGLSDTSLGGIDVTYYNNGTTTGTRPTGANATVVVVAPGATPGSGQYPNPAQNYGAMIQFPLLVGPLAIVFDPVYKKVRQADGTLKEYAFNIARPRAGGGLRIDTNTMCAIFNGDIINWNSDALTGLNGNVSLKDPSDPGSFSVPLQIVGRQDSSGATSNFSRYLANVCVNYGGNSYLNSHSRLPGTYVDSTGTTQTTETGNKDLTNVVWNKASATNAAPAGEQVGLFTLADGTDGLTKYVNFSLEPDSTAGDSLIQGRIGYAGPDYALPYATNTGVNTYNLFTADLENAAGNFVAPTPASAAAAYKNILPPETSSSGKYVQNPTCGTSSQTGLCRANPQDWVQAADKSAVIANPTGSDSYPIIGTTNFLGYTCYANTAVYGVVVDFFNYYLASKTISDKKLGLLANAGFSPVPTAFVKAVQDTFIVGTSQNLAFKPVSSGAPQCTGKAGA